MYLELDWRQTFSESEDAVNDIKEKGKLLFWIFRILYIAFTPYHISLGPILLLIVSVVMGTVFMVLDKHKIIFEYWKREVGWFLVTAMWMFGSFVYFLYRHET